MEKADSPRAIDRRFLNGAFGLFAPYHLWLESFGFRSRRKLWCELSSAYGKVQLRLS